ncbi:flagellar hook-basal body complex protein [Pontibacterium granulatum]|uniref:flagellar hook-basal body complex protein n=1 Tax=Pontibacterium granulatum TaxID=2036029 RepID=UPI00249BFEC1|nr:flagellar hook-basal body complex protein [Pontibacterium granulatum]MDI3322918.1 flagellar hook-basal body complex protein [Pontibacterium granulatum]
MAGFNTAVTGIKAAQTDLDVTGNNIANSSTIGFKGSRTEFGDIYATAVVGAGAANVAGSGVTITDIAQDFRAGTIEFTNNNLDLAINGSGFFQLDDGQGGVTYTRAGSFELNKDGNIVSKTGKFLQGFGLDAQGNQLPIGDLAVTQTESPPKATEDIDLSFNIDSRDDASTLSQPYSKDDPNSLTYSTTVRTFDSLGNEHTIKYDFVEQPAHREVQTISFLGTDFATTADADSDGRADANISISSATVNLTVLQKSIGVQPEFGNIGEVKGVTIAGLEANSTSAAESLTLDFAVGSVTISDIDNSGGAYTTPAGSVNLAALLAGSEESSIVSQYNSLAAVTAGTAPKLLGVAVDPQDSSTLIFQFDNTASAPAAVTITDNDDDGGVTQTATVISSSPVGSVTGWELGDTIDVGAEVDELLTTDPRIAQVRFVDGAPNDLVVRFNADATDVEDLQVRSAADNSLRTDITITSTTLAANEVHTYTFNADDTSVFDANGLVSDYAIKIGGVSIPLNQFSSTSDIQDTIASYQQVILDANPSLEQVSFNNSGQLELTFKAELGDVNDETELEIDFGSPDLMDRTAIVEGDGGYQGVYRMYAYLNGTELLDVGKDVNPGSPNFLSFGDESNPSEPGPILIKFNSTNGLLSEINGETVVPNATAPVISITGADPANPTTTIELDLTGTTQFASASIVKSSAQDGYTKGDLVGVTFSETGEMVASFSNGQQQALGIVAVASFENQAGLTPSGDTEWIATLASGDATVNPPGTGLNGTLRSAALEQSNVDLSEELVRLIEAQRNYQANSKTLETLNAVTQSILQI